MAARDKTDDSTPRIAHTYEKLDRQNVPLWISNFKSSIVKVLSGFSHIEETFTSFITRDKTNNLEAQMDMKTVSINSLMFLVLERACENDDFMTTKTRSNGNTLINHLLRILALNDSCRLK